MGESAVAVTSDGRSPGLAVRVGAAVVLTVLVGVFDVLLGGHVVAAWGTRGYAETKGTIVSSAVNHARGGRRRRATYGVVLSYEYSVEGRVLRGTQLGASDPGSQTGSWAHDLVASLPPGMVAPVYFDPRDPTQAVLRRGVQGVDLFWPLLLVPFNLMALGIWSGVALAWRARRDGRPYQEPTTMGPWTRGLFVVGIAALVAMGAVGIIFGTDPALWVAEAAWAVVLLAGLIAGLWRVPAPRR